MFKHLLVTLDGSPRAEAVVPHAIDVARAMSADITLLRIVDAVNGDWSERGALGKQHANTAIRSLFAEQAQSYLDRVAAQVRNAGVSANTMVKQGPPARQIVDAAREVEADAIAMCTRSRKGINKLMFGSVAEAVLHETTIPILLVRAGQQAA